MKKFPKTIAVICGGFSAEREVSLVSGEGVHKGLGQGGHKALAFDLHPAGKRLRPPSWAKPLPLDQLASVLRKHRVDFAMLVLHGPGGEDGRIQGYLEMLGIPYSGSSQLAATLAMNKHVAKEVFLRNGLPTPKALLAVKGRPVSLPLPLVVKPSDQGSAVGVSIVRKASQLKGALRKAWRHGDALVERYIEGREFTVGILGEKALPVVEIRPKMGEFYDYKSKYAAGGSTHLCPAPIPMALARKMQSLALAAHQALRCRAYSRVDFMMDRKGGLWILEVNTLPGMTPVSLFPEAAKAAGYSYPRLLEEMIRLS